MKLPSRRMPKIERRPPGLFGWSLLALVAGGFCYGLFVLLMKAPWVTMAVIAVVVAAAWHASRARKRRLLAIAERRTGQTLCAFAREFDARSVDTWVIRAVFEQLQAQLADVHPNFPVRADDLLLKNLVEDPDDLDLTIMEQVAQRTGRSLDGAEANPYFANVRTVRDLVLFFDAQPRRDAV